MKRITISAIGLLLAVLPVCLQAQGLHLTPGVYLVMNGASNLVLNNTGLINNGSFIPGYGTVLFAGDTATEASFIGGENPLSFYNLTIAKSMHDVQLNNDAVIGHSISLVSGNLQLNDHLLDLGNSGTIVGERNTACITGASGGRVRITAELNSPRSVNPGNIGVAISSPADLGWTVVTREHIRQSTAGGQQGIQRYFDIEPSLNTGLRAALQFYYLDGELDGKNKAALTLFSTSEDGDSWRVAGKDESNTDSNWVVKNNIDQLHRFTLAIGDHSATKGSAEVFPNPSHTTFTVELISDEEKEAIIDLYDGSGHLLEAKRVHFIAGVNFVDWEITKYAAGTYYLVFRGQDIQNLKVIKL